MDKRNYGILKESEMKMKLTIVLVAAAMSVTTTGYARVFNEAQIESSFGFVLEDEHSITLGDIAETSGEMVSKKLDLKVDLIHSVDKASPVDQLNASKGLFEEMNLNEEMIFEQEVHQYDGISEVELWENTDMTLFIDEIYDPCDTLLLAIAK